MKSRKVACILLPCPEDLPPTPSGAIGEKITRAIEFEVEIAGAESEPGYWLVQFIGPPLPEWVEKVRETGAQIIGPLPSNALLVRMTFAQSGPVAGSDTVQWVGPYTAD